MYGLNNRDEFKEMETRYLAMVNTLSEILQCGRWDVEELFDSENNIEVGEIIANYMGDVGEMPNWNTIYYEAMLNFAAEHDLEVGVDVDIYTNSCLDTHIYVREDLDTDIIEELETLFNIKTETINE